MESKRYLIIKSAPSSAHLEEENEEDIVGNSGARQLMNSMKLVFPLHFISRKKTPNDAVTPQRQSQFTPKMKANAVLHLLSSLV